MHRIRTYRFRVETTMRHFSYLPSFLPPRRAWTSPAVVLLNPAAEVTVCSMVLALARFPVVLPQPRHLPCEATPLQRYKRHTPYGALLVRAHWIPVEVVNSWGLAEGTVHLFQPFIQVAIFFRLVSGSLIWIFDSCDLFGSNTVIARLKRSRDAFEEIRCLFPAMTCFRKA